MPMKDKTHFITVCSKSMSTRSFTIFPFFSTFSCREVVRSAVQTKTQTNIKNHDMSKVFGFCEVCPQDERCLA